MIKIAWLFSLLFVGFAPLRAQTAHLNLAKSGLALDGYDPVAYLATGKAVEGKTSISLAHDGATYRFSSTGNRDLFRASPSKYLPRYGGWCAYAMGATGEKVSVDPETFKIIDGKLYLFYNSFFNNTLKDWNKNERALKASADKNWQNINH